MKINCRRVYTERDKRNQLGETQARGSQITAQSELERETQHEGGADAWAKLIPKFGCETNYDFPKLIVKTETNSKQRN